MRAQKPTPTKGRPRLFDEVAYLRGVRDPHVLDAVYELLVDDGVDPRVAKGLRRWLTSKLLGLEDDANPNTRAKYRRLLAHVADQLPGVRAA